VEVAVDSNFDGRSDVREYYTGGDLVRRESDRNFDDRVDLVEEFDVTTHAQTRATIDTDFDGIADLLTLFEDGRPVYTVRASSHQLDVARAEPAPDVGARAGTSPIVAFTDPFAADAAVRSNLPEAGAREVWSTLPVVFACDRPLDIHGTVRSQCWLVSTERLCDLTAAVRAPRGPPRPTAVSGDLAA